MVQQQLEQPLLMSAPKKGSGQLSAACLVLSLLLNGVGLCGWMLFILLHRPATPTGLLAARGIINDRVAIEGISSSSHWARKAAAEAEYTSAIYCSGHGRAFIDTVETDEDTGRALCECNDCFTGKDCSQKTPNCVADANSGDPLFLEPFWELNAEAGAVVIPPSYRMSYVADPTSSGGITRQLERQIRRVHAFVGNAVTEGRYIVIGTGSTELINAAIASLAPPRNSTSASAVVVSRAPYYGTYRDQTKFFSSTQYKWGGDPAQAAEEVTRNSNSSLIEILASPNNPDTTMREAVLGNGAYAVYDRAYYWPHFTPITQAAQEDVMLFTLSKLTGHAGSRLGWAIVKDPEVYRRMHEYVSYNTIGVSHDTQLRASQLIKGVLSGYAARPPPSAAAAAASPEVYAQEQHLFHFSHAVMKSRWQRMQQVFQGSSRFSLQQVEPQRCSFFKSVTMPSPAYAWVRCKEAKADCYQVFMEAGILGRAGKSFGADDGHVRLSLLRRNDEFDNLMDHLAALLRHKI